MEKEVTGNSNQKTPRRWLKDITMPITAGQSTLLSNASDELGQKAYPPAQNACTTDKQCVPIKSTDDYLHHNMCRFLAEGFDFLVGIVRHLGRATLQGGICTAERFGYSPIAGL